MARPRRDTDLTIIPHRDRGSASETMRARVVDPDAPGEAHHEDYSGEVFASAFRSAEAGSETERALISALNHLLAAQRPASGNNGGGNGEPPISRKLVLRLGAAVLTVLTLIQPAVEQLAANTLSPTTALERKLDDSIALQLQIQSQQAELSATFVALAKWVVECEIADRNGSPMPSPPAPVRLLLVRDELGQSTGP